MLNENKQTLLYIKTSDDRLLTTSIITATATSIITITIITATSIITATVVSLVSSGYVASEQTKEKTPCPTIRLLLCTYPLPCNVFTEPLLSNLEANFNILTLPSSQHKHVKRGSTGIQVPKAALQV
jgi:hypothetical protein